jgi:epoxyqueuosine reductase
LPYLRASEPCGESPAALRLGKIARYVWNDHYQKLRSGLEAIGERLRTDGWQAKVAVDDNCLVDRAAAHRAGIGWFGKNTLLLVPGAGSWFVLGSVITDAVLPVSGSPQEHGSGCGRCTKCVVACPTGALDGDGALDARKCLAWLLQAEGDFPREHRAALGTRIYGCDDCQSACPVNRTSERKVPPPPLNSSGNCSTDLAAMVLASDDELLFKFGQWYVPRKEARYLRRNALIALGNSGAGSDPLVGLAITRALASSDAMIRSHAVWAAGRLGRHDLLATVRDTESDAVVLEELSKAGSESLPAKTTEGGRTW